MADQDDRLLTVEGQIHALTRAWLCLAAQMEMRGELEPEKLEASLKMQYKQELEPPRE